jgi:hypothetical protein
MNQKRTYTGTCFCGAVEITVTGEPMAMGYCHCGSCRHWSGAPVSTYTIWSPDSVKVTKGEGSVGTYNKTEFSFRKWCKLCGGHLYSEHPTAGVIDVMAAVIPDLSFKPDAHINYQETVLPMKDGLPKFKDFPEEAGGTGETMSE